MSEKNDQLDIEACNAHFFAECIDALSHELSPSIREKPIGKRLLPPRRAVGFTFCEETYAMSTHKIFNMKSDIEQFIEVNFNADEMRNNRTAIIEKRAFQRCAVKLLRMCRETRETIRWIESKQYPMCDPPMQEYRLTQQIMAASVIIDVLERLLTRFNPISDMRNIGGSAGLERALGIMKKHTRIIGSEQAIATGSNFCDYLIDDEAIDLIADALIDEWDDSTLLEIRILAIEECTRLEEYVAKTSATTSRHRSAYASRLLDMIDTAIAFRRVHSKDSVETVS